MSTGGIKVGLVAGGIFFALVTLGFGANAASIQVSLVVEVPPHFKETDGIYISGNQPSLGNWRSDALQLVRTQNPRLRTVQFEISASTNVEYKFNLGSWEDPEVSLINEDLANRKLSCSQACQRRVMIPNFRLKPFHPWPRSTNGRIQYFHDWIFPGYQNRRSIAVYLPPGYEKSRAKYPVIYATDGHNLFDKATATFGEEWQMDETLDLMIQKKLIPPVIVVGIYATERRAEEYLMNATYLTWVSKNIKGFIDQRYRTLPGRDFTTLIGSSFGGVFAYYAAWARPEVFSRFASMSTAYWWNNFAVERMVRTHQIQLLPNRFWMDMGDQEGGPFNKGVEEMNRVYGLLRNQKKWPDGIIQKQVVLGGKHDEASWAQRLDQVLLHLIGTEAWKRVR